jgi:steroid 5-alpha reductase family enzyme
MPVWNHPRYRLVDVAVILIRLGVVVLTGGAIVIAAIPILVLIDLLDSGTGWGLCPAGLEACDNPYTTGAELAILLTLGFLGCVWGIRLLIRLARRLRSDEYQVSQ